jgi:hypothetical protein
MVDLLDEPQNILVQPSWMEKHFGNTHPVAVLFYVLFKGPWSLVVAFLILSRASPTPHSSLLAPHSLLLLSPGASLAYYIFCGWMSTNFILDFVIISALLMADFWTVKNVSGRLLVGLRWWSEAGDDGNEWRFECLDEGQREVSSFDARIFWTLLYVMPVAWVGLCLLAVVKLNLDYLLLAVIAVVLSGSNAYGYHKCSKAQQNQLKGLVNRGIASGVRSYLGLS